MKTLLQVLSLTVLIMPVVSFANTSTAGNAATVQKQVTTLISPRTGIRYTLSNTGERPVIMKNESIAPVNAATVNRIVATNPALSAASQEHAKQALLGVSAQLASQ